jgi:hypothetical protein
MTNVNELVNRYVAVWNEPDADARRKTVSELWADDGVQATSETEHRGHHALTQRVTSAYEELVAGQGFVFALAGEPAAHHDAVWFRTHMLPAAGGDIAWTGSIFLILDGEGRIGYDYQFPEN